MKKAEIINDLKQMIKESSFDYVNDEIAIRELFNNYTDSLCKDNMISEDFYNRIILTDTELKSLLKVADNVSEYRDY